MGVHFCLPCTFIDSQITHFQNYLYQQKQGWFNFDRAGTFTIGPYFIINKDKMADLSLFSAVDTIIMKDITDIPKEYLSDEERQKIAGCFGRTDNTSCVYDLDSGIIYDFHYPNPRYRRGNVTVYAESVQVYDYRCVYFLYNHLSQ